MKTLHRLRIRRYVTIPAIALLSGVTIAVLILASNPAALVSAFLPAAALVLVAYASAYAARRDISSLREAMDETACFPADLFGMRASRKMRRDEPQTYVSLVAASNRLSFSGWEVYERAYPMFENQGIHDALGSDTTWFVDRVSKAVYEDDKMTVADGRALVARAVAAARQYGAQAFLSFCTAFSVNEALAAMAAGIPLEYAAELAPPATSHAVL